MASPPPVLNVHTPSSSFAVIHSFNEENLGQLFEKLSRKSNTEFHGSSIGPGWVKYQWNDSIWNLDDDGDYTIFVWRQKSPSSSDKDLSMTSTLHVHDPTQPLPSPSSYRNPSYYVFQPSKALSPEPHSAHSTKSRKTKASKRNGSEVAEEPQGEPRYRKDFERFHSENGVRTVMGSIGPVDNVRMLLKNGYRNVYISRKFAIKHGFIPSDAAPGNYGYGGLVNLGKWPITLTPASSFPNISVPVYLSEEPHFDVVLGRSFFERRQIKVSSTDPTDVVCLDTGEKIECELVVLKDGKGEIVIVT
ncbi:hypothetical protein SERLADRAFT_363212 [Serpula lacrymans var. lacrymans S7.9]|uniref:Uncharacterized protein n=1 Tax=Serpula lacrymans var. lacrymans (strain S7.9) TaxID=578457 RepID=F8P6I3_SERL9|nr:uncharacterized protein SERLADRAFT_363212 [Serpula lacrymans var. lacrymans S7.9]EGO21050.1 hypothetical protein SERLADRAFT_363212 [Serpula lacrymans var. lacrymans S7.9]